MTCNEAREAWHQRYDDAVLTVDADAELAAHLQACSICREYHERMAGLTRTLDVLRLENDRAFATSTSGDSLRLARTGTGNRADRRMRVTRWWPVALAAALLLAVSAWVLVQRGSSGVHRPLVQNGRDDSAGGDLADGPRREVQADSASGADKADEKSPTAPAMRVASELRLFGESEGRFLAVTESKPATEGVRIFWLYAKPPADVEPSAQG